MTAPTLALDGARLDALEVLLAGLTGPIDGYCLPGSRPSNWPFDSILAVPAHLAVRARSMGRLVLTDPDGTPLATLSVTSVYCAPEGSFVAGILAAIQPAEHAPARDIRFSPADRSRAAVIAVFSEVPRAEEVVQAIVEAGAAPLLFLAVSWNARKGDYLVTRVIDELRGCSARVPGSSVRFLALAALHPGMDAASALTLALDPAQSQRVLDFSVRVVPSARAPAAGCVVLLSGLSGSGKSTVARALSERLASDGVHRSVVLDGDDVRHVLSPSLGFSAQDREENLRRIGWVAAQVASVGGIAICAPIAPFARVRDEMRQMAEPASRFVLVHVATPIEVCEARDRKGLYALARAGTITDFTGINSPYEVPLNADVVIDTSAKNTHEIVESILAVLSSDSARDPISD